MRAVSKGCRACLVMVLLPLLAIGIATPGVAVAELGDSITNPVVVPEVPVEIETELAPAGSLKQAPLWKELAQLLADPYTAPQRRASFIYRNAAGAPCAPGSAGCVNVPMPPLGVYPLDKGVLTAEPLRLRTSDGEISWDQAGPLYDPDEVVPTEFGAPTQLRTVIGALVVQIDPGLDPSCPPPGCLVVSNPGDPRLPPDGTVVAVPAVIDGVLYEYDPETGDREPVFELEAPINENDFFRPASDVGGVRRAGRPYIGRPAAEVLGKALFWDMQVGSDTVQACGSCHFHAGVDNRTRNQLNPGHLGGDVTLQVTGPNQDVVASDFPFHKLADPDQPGEPLLNPGNVVSDANDVMSSMGVSSFKRFDDIPPIGNQSFGPPSAIGNVRPLLPDLGTELPDPIPAFFDEVTQQRLRRVEPRHTPTMHAAAFFFDNFWDGRARFHFNGGSVAGATDPQHHIFIDPGNAGGNGGNLTGATNGHFRDDLAEEDPEIAEQPVRVSFSSLASQAVGPPLSDFEMAFQGRNWPKLGKKLLQNRVTPLAKQLVAVDDSELGPFSNQGGSYCRATGEPTTVGKPGLCISYEDLIQLAFRRELWHSENRHLEGEECEEDPFDGYCLTIARGEARRRNRDEFRQIEANFSAFFGLSIQTWEQLLIPDDSPFDRFMDANPLAANGVAQPGEQGTLPPAMVRQLVTGSPTGNLVFPDAAFGPEELFGFDIFAGANLTAALPVGSPRNPAGQGSNPFLRTARCMLCHLGPEQSDHTISVNHGLMLSDTEFELPPPGTPEPTGPFKTVSGFLLEEEIGETAQDGVEVENRNFSILDDPATPWNEAQMATPSAVAFQDNGVYNIAVRPTQEDLLRGGDDVFGWPIALAALALKNLAGPDFEPCDTAFETPGVDCTGAMDTFDPDGGPGGGLFEETGEGLVYPGSTHTLQSINPGLKMEPVNPLMPEYMAPWLNNLPAGELHPLIDELAFAPNTVNASVAQFNVNSGSPVAEFGEIQFGSDLHCGTYDPVAFPENGWGPSCPNAQSAIPNNWDASLNGTYPFVNRVARDGAVKVPHLRNIELTGPYFHTGSYLTLRQVIDFYMRGGDFPITNAEDRDPNLIIVLLQAFGFGTTIGLPEQFMDAIPDAISQYGAMPDTTHATTPEPASSTPEHAKIALVRFLLSLTDERVKFERAPFDHPEIFVPIDGAAPENPGGRQQLLALSGVPCTPTSSGVCFRRIPAVGAGGNPTPLANFLGVSSTPVPGPNNDHFDR